ncbi:MlaC/ttg2D family ABC transporter substrate-binding protein [Desulfogranum mediterraneum]|uniref:MlaC/ttg2D family ABC transporter substrate-binding protein n=1 Tax=Desulfogranum mediterraneum TaxID=160661 RepID=UPI001378B303|nr:ABC transporter substrate-binding protein [Desulfogranum mediterraneum]
MPDPTRQLQPFIEKMIKVLADASSEDQQRFDLCQRVIDVARERFDFQEMSKRVLGRQWKKLSPEQRLEFEDLFTRLLQHAYIGKVQEYTDQEVVYLKQRIRKQRAEVQTQLVNNGSTIAVSYIMLLKGEQWKVYDVVVEGVSLVRNYKEQFREIVDSKGYAELVVKIRDKVEQIEQAGKGQDQ